MRLSQRIEQAIARATINALLAAGFAITVSNGEEDEIEKSRDPAAIFKAMFSTDENYLYVYKDKSPLHSGWVRFIYGNDGPDVVNDYTTNLEDVLAPVVGIEDDSISSRLERGDFDILLGETTRL